jgi:cytoskeleton protein RodZ
MATVGETLRAERLKRNLGLDQISGELKISSRFLEAIETEQFDKLPGGVFAKSFVRQYARLLGLDDEELAGQVQRVLEPEPAVRQLAEKPQPAASEFHVPRMESWESVGDSRFRWSSSLSAAAVFVVVLLICSGVYTWIQRPHPVESARVPPAVSPPISAPPVVSRQTVELPAPATQTATPPVTAPEATGRQPLTQQAPAQQPPTQQPPTQQPPTQQPLSPSPSAEPQVSTSVAKVRPSAPDATVRVEVTADETVWLLARADGKFSFTGTLDAHQSRTVEASHNILLRLGNAGGVSITLNGKPVGPVGPKGQVRTVQFTSGGFQIVPVKPPAALDPL